MTTKLSLALTTAIAIAGCSPPSMPVREPASSTTSSAQLAAAGVDHDHTTFAGTNDVTLFEQSWKPHSATKARNASAATVVIVHGLKDHSSRYSVFAERLARRGHAVYAFDLRGHGHSSGLRVGIESFDEYLDDLTLFMMRVKEREPRSRIVLFGHSMGGAIATLWTMKKQPSLAGLITSGGALTTRICPLKIGGTKATAAVLPHAGVFNLDLDDFSRDPAVVQAGKADPLVYQDGAPALTARELLHAIDTIEHNRGAINVPLLALHGGDDKVTSPEGSKALVEGALSADKTLKIYPKLAHDLLHEPEKEMVMADLEAWIDRH